MYERFQISAIFAALFVTYLVVKYAYLHMKARSQFPGPPVKNFWVGNLDQTMGDDVHEKWVKWNRQYGRVFQTWSGPFSRMIYIGDPAIVAKIATANWPKSAVQYDGFKPLVGGSALFSQTNQEKWRMQSKRLAPAFAPKVVREQYPFFAKHLRNYIHYLDGVAAADKTADFCDLHILLTLDFIGDIAFGTSLNALAQGTSCRILQLFDEILPELMKCGLFPLRGKIPIMAKTRKMHKAIAELQGMAEAAIKSSRSADSGRSEKAEGSAGKKIFEILANQREADGNYTFSPVELRNNYIGFLVAGGDPTAHAMSFLVYQVVKHPEVYAKLQAELDAAIPFGADIPTLEQAKLPYLEMVLKETLRFNPPGFGTFRECPVDTEVAGVMLPAKTTLALWNPAVHRDPNVWENPDVFDPERWRPGQQTERGSYFPFSYGPRQCLGKGLAMLEMTLVMATTFRRYDLSLADGFDMEFLPSFTMKPKDGLWLKVVRRTS